jgi:hypothetical protein
MRCPRCQTAVLALDKPARSGMRGIAKHEITIAARKPTHPHFQSRSKAPGLTHEPAATKTGHTAGLPLASRGPEVTFADVMGYFRTKSTRILVALCLIQLLLFCSLAWWVHLHPSWFIDVRITHEVQRPQGIVGESMKVVSLLGNVPNLFRAIVCLTAALCWVFRRRLEAVIILLVFEFSVHVNPLVKDRKSVV